MTKKGYSYSKKDCEQSLIGAAKKVGHAPSRPEYNELGLSPSARTISRILGDGSWVDAKKEVGLDTRKVSVNESFFDSIDSKEEAYWIGFFMGDGSVSEDSDVSIALSEVDKDHIQKWKDAVDSDHKVSTWSNGKNNAASLTFRSPKMASDLEGHGLGPNKTFGGGFPSIRKGLKPHFYRGWIDADGCIYKNRCTITITAATSLRLRNCFGDIPVMVKLRDETEQTGAWTLYIPGKERVRKTIEWLYPDEGETEPALNRKKRIAFPEREAEQR